MSSIHHLSVCSYGEELSRCQEEVRRLQGSLAAARDDCVGISDERLQLQQENMQLRKEMDEQRKATLLVQKKAKQQVTSAFGLCLLSVPVRALGVSAQTLLKLNMQEHVKFQLLLLGRRRGHRFKSTNQNDSKRNCELHEKWIMSDWHPSLEKLLHPRYIAK